MTSDQILLREQTRRTRYQQEREYVAATLKCIPLPPKVIDPPKRGYQKQTTCRRCGAGISEAHWNYCPNCGQAIKAASFAGTQGWTHDAAEKAFRKMMEGESDD